MIRGKLSKYAWAITRRIYWTAQALIEFIGFSLVAHDPLFLKGMRLSRRTDERALQDLILSLRPMETKVPLIRIGSKSDGGYLLPQDFDDVTTCFSAGCDLTWHFEKQLDTEFNVRSVILDSIDKRPTDLGPKQTYVPFWLGNTNNEKFITFDKWMSDNLDENDDDLILQMDIEGAEYEAIIGLEFEKLKRFRIIVLELHNLANFKNQRLFDEYYRPTLSKLTDAYDIAHAHANNCCGNWKSGDIKFPKVLELTLLRKDRNGVSENFAVTPHALDVDCVPSKLSLPLEWPTKK